jgi:hypothetical protein
MLQNSGVPEFCHEQWHKSETSDLCGVRGTTHKVGLLSR